MSNLNSWLADAADTLARTRAAGLGPALDAAVAATAAALRAGHPLLLCGNGGSAADAQHIAAELVGRFLRDRRPYRAISLVSDPAILTAWANDHAFAEVFSRQVQAHAAPGAVLLGLSTSGTSENVVRAFAAARAAGMVTIAMTGEGGGRLAALSDHLLAVPSRSTPAIQQVHLCLYHCFCAGLEDALG